MLAGKCNVQFVVVVLDVVFVLVMVVAVSQVDSLEKERREGMFFWRSRRIAWNVRVLATVPPGRECCVSRRAARRGVIVSWKT